MAGLMFPSGWQKRSIRLALVSLVLSTACGATEREPASTTEPAPVSTASEPPVAEPPPTEPAEARCLPIIHGCGCAYQCALGEPREDGRWDVTHAAQDSRIDVATLERRCFDTQGRSFLESDDLPDPVRCMDVYYDQSPCGGECIPTTEFLDCAIREGSCAPAPSP
jgi:hypothetical protein